MARNAKAHGQPMVRTIGGTSWMEMVVSRNPSDVCSVSAVPTACGGALSVTSTLNWALSAMMKKPHTSATGVSSQSERPKERPTRAQQTVLTESAMMTSRGRPMRSATAPPQTHPMPPTAMMANPMTDAVREGAGVRACGDAAMLAATKAGIQVQ